MSVDHENVAVGPASSDEEYDVAQAAPMPKGGMRVGVAKPAVTVTHRATGISATSSEERTQYRNYVAAMEACKRAVAAASAPVEAPVPRSRIPVEERQT